MAVDYTAADALSYIREAFDTGLDWIHETLATAYGLETIDGEEYLPGALNDVMACLYGIHRTVTEESTTMGLHSRSQGRLSRPRTYSNELPLYVTTSTQSGDSTIEVESLQHPGGFNHDQVAASGSNEGCAA